ncbi:MAG: transcription termination factor NusA [Patescibacteria group bacterium]|nr:transcription termination factor NusA [Patescibacteria group bacterium]MBU1160774.1 transcription termination factor NusA [Patescibacteria group bacterium]MBU1684049.1 transcription termination factor NusA [Patescibacteria group bacterium]MBU1778378.1 transcription termination factor NusA [Patescibacteria group bacterium]MBU1987642.1 transcription termination factor NusA [Patescibacteria group bacterium]
MSELQNIIKSICEEKGLNQESVISAIESSLSAAYRKDFGNKNQNIKVLFDPETGESKVYDVKTVVEDVIEEDENPESTEHATSRTKFVVEDVKSAVEDENAKPAKSKDEKTKNKEDKTKNKKLSLPVKISEDNLTNAENNAEENEEKKFNPKTEIQLSDSKLLKKTAKIGEEIKTRLEVPASYGRVAAQTAKQVIIQRLREAEREMIFNEFKDKEKEVVSGIVQRREGKTIFVDLGKTIGFLPVEEQIFSEQYNQGDRIKVYIKEVKSEHKGANIILSRTSEEILRKIFYLEIPEITNNLVELKAISREAGFRSKVAVWTDSKNVDPIGSCVGQRGSRIQTIMKELGGEKIDIIEYHEDSAKFVSNALSPAKILGIDINDKTKVATVKVSPDQLSLAIGKNGQNVRLAARLTKWKINIIEDTAKKDKQQDHKADDVKKEEKTKDDKPQKTEEKTEEKIIDDEQKDAKKLEKDEKKKTTKTKTKTDVKTDKTEISEKKSK